MKTTSRMLFYPAIEEYVSYDEILITQRRYLSDIDLIVTSLGGSDTYYFCRRSMELILEIAGGIVLAMVILSWLAEQAD